MVLRINLKSVGSLRSIARGMQRRRRHRIAAMRTFDQAAALSRKSGMRLFYDLTPEIGIEQKTFHFSARGADGAGMMRLTSLPVSVSMMSISSPCDERT